MNIEPLETRIAPATLVNPATITYTDIDGDKVTVTTSAGAFVFTNPPNGTAFTDTFVFSAPNAIGGQQLLLFDLRQGSGFQGADLTFSVVKAGSGDGLAAVGLIFAPGIDLGKVTVKGDLGEIDCGDTDTATPGLKALSVRSMGRYGLVTQEDLSDLHSIINGALGALRVAEDIKDARIDVTATVDADAKIGSITIGGSVIGGAANDSGSIRAEGGMGSVKVGGDLIGGDGFSSGQILSDDAKIGDVTIGGSIIGGSNTNSGLLAGGELGVVKIGGNVKGGTEANTGNIRGVGKIVSVTIGGSLLGGAADTSGSVLSSGDIGPVKIAHDVKGGAGDESGKFEAGGKITSVTIGGSLLGGDGDQDTGMGNGQIVAANIGAITIGHDVKGGSGDASARIEAGTLGAVAIGGSLLGGSGLSAGGIAAASSIGAVKIGHDIAGGTGSFSGRVDSDGALASVTVGGSLIGGLGNGSGRIGSEGDLGPVKIGHDVKGGAGQFSGIIETGSIGAIGGTMAGVTIGGSLIGGSNLATGGVSSEGDMAFVKIGHDLIGGSISGTMPTLQGSGFIESDRRIGSVFIGGSIIAGTDDSTAGRLIFGARIDAAHDIGSVTVRGGLIGNVTPNGNSFVIINAIGQAAPGATSDVAIGRISVGGRVEFAQIFGGYDDSSTPFGVNADAQIGSVTVGGDWIASSIVAGAFNTGADVDPSDDNVSFGDPFDEKITGGIANRFSKIGRIEIAGHVFGQPGSSPNFGFVAEEIAALKIGGVTFTLQPGRNNDGRILGAGSDMRLHEIGTLFPVNPLPTASAKLVSASTISYDDIDGDHVTVRLSKPLLTSLTLASAVFTFDTGLIGDGVPARQQLQLIDLRPLAANGVTVTVTVAPGGGDRLANVGALISGDDLGTITIPGDLGQIAAGDAVATTRGLGALNVRTLGRLGTDTQPAASATFTPFLGGDILGGLGSLSVKQDFIDANIAVTGPIGPITIGGSLIGGAATLSGAILNSGNIGAVRIGHHVQGGAGLGSGLIDGGKSIASVTVGGSLIGGNINADGATLGAVRIAHNVIGGIADRAGFLGGNTGVGGVTVAGSLIGGIGTFSGRIFSGAGIGAVRIGHNVAGGAGGDSGQIDSVGKLASLTIGGSLLGGGGGDSGAVITAGDMGAVKIGRNLVGGGGGDSGNLQAGGKLTSVIIGGSLLGAGGGDSGEITSAGDMGAVKIGHDLIGGGGGTSGNISSDDKLVSLTIGGSLVGGPAGSSGRIMALSDMGAVKIGHDMLGGTGSGAGVLLGSKLAAVSIRGSLVGGSMDEAGEIHFTGDIGAVTIGRDLIGGSISAGSLNETGYIDSVAGRIARVTIGGSIIAGIDDSTTGALTMNGSIRAGADIGTLSVKGSLIGNAAPNGATPVVISARGLVTPPTNENLAIGSVTIGGRVERANIFGGYTPELVAGTTVAQIGTVTVGRDWIASNLVVGVVNLGADDLPGGAGANADNVNFGDAHDTFIGLGNIQNRIASIVIRGIVVGTAGGGDHFGFASVQIGSFKSLGFTAPLTAGATSDAIELSPITRDVTLREL